MTRQKDLEQRLQRLLKHRRIPVDEERLEAMREGLLRRVPQREPIPDPGFFRKHRFALSYGTALVLIGLFVWQVYPLRRPGPPPLVGSKFIGIAQDEEQLDHMLVLLSGFTLSPSKAGTLIEWEFYNRSFLGDNRGDELFKALYGWSYDSEES